MLKKIALVGLFAVATVFGAAAPVAAKSGEAKSVKPAVKQPAPQGFCPMYHC
jgi:hypothetical protein